jgi:hypothetical protein
MMVAAQNEEATRRMKEHGHQLAALRSQREVFEKALAEADITCTRDT